MVAHRLDTDEEPVGDLLVGQPLRDHHEHLGFALGQAWKCLACRARSRTGPLLVQTTFILSVALIAEGALSFLGLGVQPPQPSLGSLLRDGKPCMKLAPWTMFFPALTLAGLILAINLLGDELQAVIDPRLRGR